MTKIKTNYCFSIRPLSLGLAVVFFFAFGINTYIGAVNTFESTQHTKFPKVTPERFSQKPFADKLQVLTPKDAELYRAIFDAQAKGDVTTADRIAQLLSNRALMGHVLADRYQRQSASRQDIQAWLAEYKDLPEANFLYDLATHLKAIKAGKLTRPVTAASWSGGGYGASAGFQTGDGGMGHYGDWLRGLEAWKSGDISEASHIFGILATENGLSSWDRAAAQFWTYRALKRMGQTDQAYYFLRQAAEQPHTFYGLLANNLMGRDTERTWQLPEFSDKQQATLAAIPAGMRALALIQIGKTDLAEAELQRLNPLGKRDLQEAMIALADRVPMPALALRLGALAVNSDGKLYDAALYPVPVWKPTSGFQVDRALLYAIMRHESQFDPTAVSGRGACGLMQLMPSTARLIAKEKATTAECSDSLFDANTNLELGQSFVQNLAAQPKIGDNVLLLLAAYNGGPNRIEHWMDAASKRDPLLFIENLPVRETRDYVQQVLMHYVMYRARLGQTTLPLEQLAHGEWPRYALRDNGDGLAVASK